MAVDYDVIVVGSGAAGLSAAVSAADTGARVLVMEADTHVGGSSRLSGGHFYAAGTSVQAAAGEADSPDAMFDHYMTLNQWLVEPAVVRRYCDLSAPTFEWLIAQGVEFPVAGLYASGVGPSRRGHQPTGGGEAVVQALEARCSQRNVDFVLDARVERLLTADSTTEVCGIAVGSDEATSNAVVMAAGGFGANPALLQTHYPDAAAAGNWAWYIGSPMARGDGLLLGQSVGAALDGHNRGLLLVTPGFSRDLEVALPGWVVLVNQAGRRFTDETAPYTVLAGLIQHQSGPVYAVFDHLALQNAKPGPVSQAVWVTDALAREIETGTVCQAATLQELARRLGIHAAGLEGTLRGYNQDCADGTDARFFKQRDLQPIAQPPFYAAEIRPGIICWTGAGLRINADTEVMGEDEMPIPGLYAAGETVGSLHGDRYVGGGGSFGPCIVFGKLAGEIAARYALGRRG